MCSMEINLKVSTLTGNGEMRTVTDHRRTIEKVLFL